MKIADLFVANVTRDIPPVVYFHEQRPEKLKEEVSEYIITGGYPDNHPGSRRVKSGIHEQFVHLLRAITQEMGKKGGPENPACWISGFYGSGKSSFAKLLGLSLDGKALPDGTLLSKALLDRDDSPKRDDLVSAWNDLLKKFQPMAVVFDIGGVARDDEHIHSAALRQVQERLGYCSKSSLVADFELRLEKDGEYPAFVATAERVLGRPWKAAKEEEQAEDHFSHVLHVMKPDRYPDPMSWIDARAGRQTGAGSSVVEVVRAIESMLDARGDDKALFIVIDEVSQYVHQDEGRMLKLQTFVMDLGQQLKGRVWLLATGQQKLEDTSESNNIGKLKDRFLTHLRVHLAPANIRDVVHKRLLKKKPEREGVLRELFQKHRSDLKLHGYGCQEITEEDFVEVYPMLPGHIDLLMQITSNLRIHSKRMQGDDHAIRGLLQLLGELFRAQKLAEGEVGDLVTLDSIFEVQQTALDADVQNTLQRIFSDPGVRDDALAIRCAKAVALLEQLQDQNPPIATTSELVSQCLYSRVGQGSQVQAVTDALERLRSANHLSYSEKQGYKIQSSAGQDWEEERREIGIGQEKIAEIVQEALKHLVGSMQERPKWKGRPFPWTLFFSDKKQAHDLKLQDTREDSTVTVDFQFLGKKEDRSMATWINWSGSGQEQVKNRILWLVSETGTVEDLARQLAKSEKMLLKYRDRRESLKPEQRRLLGDEEASYEQLEGRVRAAIGDAFLEGNAFFRGQHYRPRDNGGSFGTALLSMALRALPDLYPHFAEIAVTPAELNQILDPNTEVSGISKKFMREGLGIFDLDAGKYLPNCSGVYPQRVLSEIERHGGLSGQTLIGTFVSPPYGYAADLVKACIAGLLRAKKIRVQPDTGDEMTSFRDPGVKDLFARDRDFRRAEFFPAKASEIERRDRVAIRKLFLDNLRIDIDPEDEPIADAVTQHFQKFRDDLRDVERKFNDLPNRPEIPLVLKRFGKALEDCCRPRVMLKTVIEVKRNLDALRDGFEQLGLCTSELTPEVIDIVKRAGRIKDHELAQLQVSGDWAGLTEEATLVTERLATERPWKDAASLVPAVDRIRARYVEVRRAIIQRQTVEAEAARSKVKIRPGFAQLEADAAHRVLRPIAEAMVDTTAEALAPTLVELRDRFSGRIGQAVDLANDRLDEELSRKTETQVVRVESHIRGMEVTSREQLKGLLNELEERIGPHLDRGARVRIT
jgi:hypothetical protein